MWNKFKERIFYKMLREILINGRLNHLFTDIQLEMESVFSEDNQATRDAYIREALEISDNDLAIFRSETT